MTVTTVEAPLRTVYPIMRYRDPLTAAEWLTRVIGFTQKWIDRDPDGTITHIELVKDTGMVMFGVVKEGLNSSPGEGMYLAVEDVVGHYERAKAEDANIVYPPRDSEYGNGTQDFEVRDPEGRPWYIGSYRP